MSLVILDPTSGPVYSEASPAPRLDTLTRTVAGVIDNGKRNTDVVIARILERLRADYELTDVHFFKKPSSSHGIERDEAARLAESCDFVIAGVGD